MRIDRHIEQNRSLYYSTLHKCSEGKFHFFIRGITGLTVAIGSVVTLAILMRVTASVDWNRVFVKPIKISKTDKQTVLKTDGSLPL